MLQLILEFNVQDISKYRSQLMGVATFLVIFGHSVGNGVLMPNWMESLCGLASVGVDIFLVVSGLGLWYSLNNVNTNRWGGVKYWYLRRYKRILIPYLLIIGLHKLLSVLHGQPILQAVLELSTVSYWINHRGAWFIAMLIPLYAITPLHYKICQWVKSQVLYSFVLIGIIVLVSVLNYPMENSAGKIVIANIKHVLYHLPSFFIGFMLAPYALSNKKISNFWVIILPLAAVVIMKYMQWGYWPEFLVFPFLPILCCFFKSMGSWISSVLVFFGKISLESYLFNGVVGAWIIWYLPQLYYSPLNKGCYLSYFMVCFVGTILAYFVNRLCNSLIKRSLFILS